MMIFVVVVVVVVCLFVFVVGGGGEGLFCSFCLYGCILRKCWVIYTPYGGPRFTVSSEGFCRVCTEPDSGEISK